METHVSLSQTLLGENHENVSDDLRPSRQSAHEYAEAVRVWLLQHHWAKQMGWYINTIVPIMAMNCAALNVPNTYQNVTMYNPMYLSHSRVVSEPSSDNSNTQTPASTTRQQSQQQLGQEFTIPPLWRRVVAEFIDFFLLFTMKLGVSLLALDYIGLVDIERYDLDALFNEWDSNAALAVTTELIAMEVINRIAVCIFETICLWRGVRGATPGKRIMHLQVVACSELYEISGDKVRISPSGNLGFWSALLRSVLKNFSIALLFPLCLTAVLSPHKRASYDLIAGSIVVEDELRPLHVVM